MVRKVTGDTLMHPVKRRDFLKGASAVGIAGVFPAIITRRAFAADVPTVVNSIRSLSNPYHATWNQGGAAFAKSIGADYVTLVTEGDSEKGIADIRAILAKTGGYVDQFFVDIGDKVDGPERNESGEITKPGQLLAKLIAPELDEELQQKEATVTQVAAEIEPHLQLPATPLPS